MIEFSTTRGSEIAPSLSLSVESSGLAKMIAKLQGGATVDFKKSQDETNRHELSTILRINILRSYWEDQKKIKRIHEASIDALSKPHALIDYTGSNRFAEQIDDMRDALNDDQFLAANKQYQFEKRNENEDHDTHDMYE